MRFPTFSYRVEQLAVVHNRNLALFKIVYGHNHLKGAIFALSACPAQNLNEVWFIFRNIGLNDVHSSFLIDVAVVNSEVCSSGECWADESDSVACACVVDERISHLRRHLLSYLINVCCELVEFRRAGNQVQLLLSLEEDQNWPLVSSNVVNSVKEIAKILAFIACMETNNFSVGISINGRKSVYVCDLIIFFHDLFSEIWHGFDSSWDAHNVVEVFG